MPLSGTTTDKDGNVIGDGVAFVLFHEIQQKLGFTYTIVKPDINEIGNTTSGAMKLLHNEVIL